MTKRETWDEKPEYVIIDGVPREMFRRSHLARALNRQIGTIRSMERLGVLSTPRWKNARGRWLYSREQIEDLVQLAKEEKVIDPAFRRPFTDRFIKEAVVICRRRV